MRTFYLFSSLYFCLNSIVYASNIDVSSLSKLKREQIDLTRKNIEAEAVKAEYFWLSPIVGSFSKQWTDEYSKDAIFTNYSLSVNQPIFKSGGIYFRVEHAKANRFYSNLRLQAKEKEMVKEVASLLYKINALDLEIKKQELLVENAKIDIERKTEAYNAGALDGGFLDNSMLAKNQQTLLLFDMIKSKKILVLKLETMSDIEYKNIELPTLNLVDEQTYVNNNLDIQQSNTLVRVGDYAKKMVISEHLPTVSLSGSFNYSNAKNSIYSFLPEKTHYRKYGIQISIPFFDFSTIKSIESAKLNHLKLQNSAEDTKRNVHKSYKIVVEGIADIDQKISLTKEDKNLYLKLLDDTKLLYSAGERTEYDVMTLQNSVYIKEYELMVLDLNKQQELLILYSKMNHI